MCRTLAIGLSLVLSSWCAARAQVAWTKQNDITARQGHTMVYDSARGRIVVFGGEFALRSRDDTWEWDGASWTLQSTAHRPVPRNGQAMAYDSSRQRTVLFGGVDGTTRFGDTWEYDGNDWQLVATTGPQPRYWAQMTFDAATGRTLLFGGSPDGSGVLGDTWEWDGAVWRQSAPAQSPAPRLSHALGYDPVRRRAVLFGGLGVGWQRLGDTWEWDGATATWTPRAVSGPAPAPGWSISYDPGRAVLLAIGQEGTTLANSGLWSWDGSVWQRLTTTTRPRPFAGFTMAYDAGRRRAVLFGGLRSLFYEEATWEWDGNDWAQVTSGPGPRGGYRMDYDSQRAHLVMIGAGTGTEVWVRPSGGWQLVRQSPSVPWWEWPGFAFHAKTGDAVRFGGLDARVPRVVDETWTWDGTAWQRRFPSTSPPARMGTAMVGDPDRDTVLLFGGLGTGVMNDTWEWDGTNWKALQPAQSPPARMHHALAFDARRHRIVLFGGYGLSATLGDTWEWDGGNWLPMQPAQSPPPTAMHGLAYDAARQRVVLFGSLSASEQTWEWDGVDWRLRAPAVAPRGRGDLAIGYDPGTESVVVFGGTRSQPVAEAFADTWELAATEPSRYSSLGQGCAGTQGVPVLAARDRTRPWLGEVFTLTIAPLPTVAVVVLSFGRSKSTWRGVPLPLDLGTFGMPGCSLFVSADVDFWQVASGGSAAFAFAIPADPALLGAAVLNQAWVSDPGANALGVVVSNAMEGVVGTR